MRYLNSTELHLLLPGAIKFAEMAGITSFNKDAFIPIMANIVRNGSGCIIVTEKNGELSGAIGGMTILDVFTGELVASEMFWFSLTGSGNGLALMKEFEMWAKSKGCIKIQMALLHRLYPDSLSKLYIRKGYFPTETMFAKEV